ncbi:hypothetical protein N7523_006965, partial [Penicillium sp. IBT 18751x]
RVADDAMPEKSHDSVIPAQLSFLAIYNPTLGPTDETVEDQIVFHTSKAEHQRTEDSQAEEGDGKRSESDRNEKLRQIGLAQGMVSFASNFSDKPMEYVETDKSRVVLLELETDWWIVASIDLTRLPADPSQKSSGDGAGSPAFQYSAREMGPPQLVIQQLRRAHAIFLLLHDFSLSNLYERVGRSAFCLFLERFWEKFAWNWELLLTGNPIVEIYNGIKLAAGGELGIGVGEEEWGSGEREVLEDFVARTEGLIDLVVSRFGDPSRQANDSPLVVKNGESQWLGSDNDPRPADGVVFSGTGTVNCSSIRHLSHWMEWIFRYGDAAYGIGRDPNSLRRRRPRRQRRHESAAAQPSTPELGHMPGIPRPLVLAEPQPLPKSEEITPERGSETPPLQGDQTMDKSMFPKDTVMKYLTLGYGSAWSFSAKPSSEAPPGSPSAITASTSDTAGQNGPPETQSPPPSEPRLSEQRKEPKNHTQGRFVLGPRDDLDTLDDLEEGSPEPEVEGRSRSRIIHRTVHVQLHGSDDVKKLQAVIYVHQPFMFTFLFDPEISSLSSPSLYTSIHHQLGPLQKPLLASTSPTTAASRISMTEGTPDFNKRQVVYDLVYDPSNLTIRSSIPNIPSLSTPSHIREPSGSPRTPSPSSSQPSTLWSRVESLATQHRLLSTYIDTRTRLQELERTSKTNRGWWIVWMRFNNASTSAPALSLGETQLPSTAPSPRVDLVPSPAQEAFIVRKSSDYVSPASHARISSGARFFRDLGGASSTKLTSSRANDTTPSKLVEGLGMDTRRYIEGLLSLNRS